MQPLLVISNRLPATISCAADGSYVYGLSSGGLVSALLGLQKGYAFRWIGWPGMAFPVEQQSQVTANLAASYNCLPVFLTEQQVEGHCNAFSNGTLWPILHYLPNEVNA